MQQIHQITEKLKQVDERLTSKVNCLEKDFKTLHHLVIDTSSKWYHINFQNLKYCEF